MDDLKEPFFDIKGRVAIITGGSRGIGRAISLALARVGVKIVVSSRQVEACQSIVKHIEEHDGVAFALKCDIGRPEDIEKLVNKTAEEYGSVDFLICNAAINPVYCPTKNLDDNTFNKIIQSNLRSSMWLVNSAMQYLEESDLASIIFISSIAALKAMPNIGCYSMSKAALESYARSLATELGPKNICVNTVAPGLIKTDFSKVIWEAINLDEHKKRVPMGRIGLPDDVSGLVRFLVSKSARFITGQTIRVDGGESIN